MTNDTYSYSIFFCLCFHCLLYKCISRVTIDQTKLRNWERRIFTCFRKCFTWPNKSNFGQQTQYCPMPSLLSLMSVRGVTLYSAQLELGSILNTLTLSCTPLRDSGPGLDLIVGAMREGDTRTPLLQPCRRWFKYTSSRILSQRSSSQWAPSARIHCTSPYSDPWRRPELCRVLCICRKFQHLNSYSAFCFLCLVKHNILRIQNSRKNEKCVF